MTDVLEEAGYHIETASNGEDAFIALKKNPFDVALIDVMMPKMDGYHLAAKINGLPQKPKIVIVTSRDFDRDEETVNRIGAAAFLSKPFSKKELLDAVSNLL